MEEMLKYNFYLSKWFAGKNEDKIVPGTSFLFLNQVSFLLLAAFLSAIKLLPFVLSPKISTAIVIFVLLFVMCGMQKNVQARVREKKYDKSYNTLTTKEIFVNRIVALVLFIMPFVLCFIVAILFYR